MKATVIKLHPSPSEKAAKLRRQAVGRERVEAGCRVMFDGLDDATAESVRLAAIRALSGIPERSPGQTIGTLCKTVADLSPAYRGQRRKSAAEALFKRSEGE